MARSFEWNAPAKLFFWPCDNGGDEEVVYPTLVDALRAAGEGDIDTAWIITQSGDILNPRLIDEIRFEVPRQRPRTRSLLGWSRAA